MVSISKEKYKEQYGFMEEVTYFVNSINHYLEEYEVIVVKQTNINCTGFGLYRKKNYKWDMYKLRTCSLVAPLF